MRSRAKRQWFDCRILTSSNGDCISFYAMRHSPWTLSHFRKFYRSSTFNDLKFFAQVFSSKDSIFLVDTRNDLRKLYPIVKRTVFNGSVGLGQAQGTPIVLQPNWFLLHSEGRLRGLGPARRTVRNTESGWQTTALTSVLKTVSLVPRRIQTHQPYNSQFRALWMHHRLPQWGLIINVKMRHKSCAPNSRTYGSLECVKDRCLFSKRWTWMRRYWYCADDWELLRGEV